MTEPRQSVPSQIAPSSVLEKPHAAVVSSRLELPEAKTIQVKPPTKEKLDELGRKGETYDMIINMLIRFYEENNVNARRKRALALRGALASRAVEVHRTSQGRLRELEARETSRAQQILNGVPDRGGT